jgi:hypothetical protein
MIVVTDTSPLRYLIMISAQRLWNSDVAMLKVDENGPQFHQIKNQHSSIERRG